MRSNPNSPIGWGLRREAPQLLLMGILSLHCVNLPTVLLIELPTVTVGRAKNIEGLGRSGLLGFWRHYK